MGSFSRTNPFAKTLCKPPTNYAAMRYTQFSDQAKWVRFAKTYRGVFSPQLVRHSGSATAEALAKMEALSKADFKEPRRLYSLYHHKSSTIIALRYTNMFPSLEGIQGWVLRSKSHTCLSSSAPVVAGLSLRSLVPRTAGRLLLTPNLHPLRLASHDS